MKIKYRNLLTITPIFFIIVLVISILNYYNDKNEIMWGINQEAKSIAIGSSIFIENIISNSTIIKESDKILMHLNIIKKYKQANEFYIINNNNKIILTTEKNITKKALKKEPIELKDKNIILSKIYTDNNNSFLNATTTIKKDKKIVATLTVKVNANNVIKYLTNSIYTLIITIVIISIIGVLVSTIISNIVIKRIRILKEVSNSIAEGNYHDKGNLLDIKEFKDLEDTLNTMKSIMQEILFKAKNSIIEWEQFSSNDDLGYIYSNVSLKSKIEVYDNIEIGIKKIGNIKVETLFDIVSNKEKIFSFMGEVEKQDKSIDSAINASTANYYLSKKLIYNNNLDFINEFINDFSIKKLFLIEINKKTLNLNKYQIIENNIKKSSIKIDENNLIYFDTNKNIINNNIYRELDSYIKNYKFLTINEIEKDLDRLFSKRYNGLLFLIKKRELKLLNSRYLQGD